jgi:hypothetical protein
MSDKLGRNLFTAGSVILIVLGLAHSISLFEKTVPANETERQLIDLMTNYRFNLLGSMRSMDTMLRGFSVSFMLTPLALGALNFALLRERSGLLKRVAMIDTLWLAAMTAVSLHYFFAAPTAFLVVALAVFTLAWLKLPSEHAS